MFPLEPLPAAKKAVAYCRKGVELPLDFGPVGDMLREAIEAGIGLWYEQSRGHIYLAQNAGWPDVYKIGCTRKSVEQRMRSLNGEGLLTPWQVLGVWDVYDAHGLEAQVHRRISKKRLRGELFKGPVAELQEAIEQVLAEDRARMNQGLECVLGSPIEVFFENTY